MASKGRSILIQSKINSGEYVTIAGMRSKTITLNNETTDSSDDDSLSWRELEGDVGTRGLSISGTAVFKDDAHMIHIESLAESGDADLMQVTFDNRNTIEGYFVVGSFEYNGEHDNLQMASFTLESAGGAGESGGAGAGAGGGSSSSGLNFNRFGVCSLSQTLGFIDVTPVGVASPFRTAPSYHPLSELWMAVTEEGIVYTSDDMNIWNELPADALITVTGSAVTGLVSIEESIGAWIVAVDHFDGNNYLYRSVDDGLSWSLVADTGNTPVTRIKHIIGDVYFAISLISGFRSVDGGITWQDKLSYDGIPWEASDFSYTTVIKNLNSFDGNFDFDSSGLRAFGFSSSGARTFTLTTAWDLSTMDDVTFEETHNFSPSNQQDGLTGQCLSLDGKHLYLKGVPNIVQWDLSTPFLMSTATLAGSFNIETEWGGAGECDLAIRPDGTHIYAIRSSAFDATLYEYELTIPFDITTATSTGKSFFHNANSFQTPNFLDFKSDGTRFMVAGRQTDEFQTFDLSVPWDVTTAVSSSIASLSASGILQGSGGAMKPDGTKFYPISSAGSGPVAEYSLTQLGSGWNDIVTDGGLNIGVTSGGVNWGWSEDGGNSFIGSVNAHTASLRSAAYLPEIDKIILAGAGGPIWYKDNFNDNTFQVATDLRVPTPKTEADALLRIDTGLIFASCSFGAYTVSVDSAATWPADTAHDGNDKFPATNGTCIVATTNEAGGGKIFKAEG